MRLELTYTPAGSSTPKTCIFETTGVALDGANLAATGTFGQDCPTAADSGSTPVGTPSFVDSLSGDVASTVTAGSPAKLTWRADADTCTYDGTSFPAGVASIAGWPTSGDACTSAATCNTAHTASLTMPSTAGEYRFKLTCSKNGNPTPVSSEAVTRIDATGGQGQCIAPAGLTRQTSTVVCDVDGNRECRDVVDATRFDLVFGTTTLQPNQVTPWPGRYNLQQRPLVNNNRYLALQFTVPADYRTDAYGFLGIAETWYDGRLSMTLSTACGDFGETNQIAQRCILSGPNAASHPSQLGWTTYTSGPTHDGLCPLEPGRTYYLNILYAPVADPLETTCEGFGSCQRAIQNGPGRF
ncbi:MAG TPA: hypothetical protein VJ724_09675 [Tahibacter sp.]|nr:hypothetical protein [Tahibacter sp.]